MQYDNLKLIGDAQDAYETGLDLATQKFGTYHELSKRLRSCFLKNCAPTSFNVSIAPRPGTRNMSVEPRMYRNTDYKSPGTAK